MFKILKFEHFQVRLLDTDLAQTEKGVTRAQLRRCVFFLTQLRGFLANWEGKNSTNPFHPYCATSIYVGVFMIILKILMFWFFRQNDVWTLLAAAVGGDKRGEDNTILPYFHICLGHELMMILRALGLICVNLMTSHWLYGAALINSHTSNPWYWFRNGKPADVGLAALSLDSGDGNALSLSFLMTQMIRIEVICTQYIRCRRWRKSEW